MSEGTCVARDYDNGGDAGGSFSHQRIIVMLVMYRMRIICYLDRYEITKRLSSLLVFVPARLSA